MEDMKDNWAIRLIEVDNFTATAAVNRGYLDFERKNEFPFLLSIELSLLDTVDDRPSGDENYRLEDIEENLLNIFRNTQEVHYIGHITRNGYRDILCYVASKDLDIDAITNYCNTIEIDRNINIEIDEDPLWETAYGVLR